MEIFIRNMVCDRCIRSVQRIFEEAGVGISEIRLGSVVTAAVLDHEQTSLIRHKLQEEGFEWMDDQKAKIVEQIRHLIRQLVQSGDLDSMKENLSVYLSRTLLKDYYYLSQLFSSLENTTIEQYFILQKIEKVKEWLVYDELSVNEIAFKLGYSSAAHLSGQFRKITGFSPTEFRQFKDHYRKSIDRV